MCDVKVDYVGFEMCIRDSLTEDSHVIWAVGQRISADYKIDENTKKILEVHFFGGNYHESKEY